MNLSRNDPRPQESEENLITAQNNRKDIGFILDNSEKLKISTKIPKLFKIPFWLVSLPPVKKVEKKINMKLKLSTENEGRLLKVQGKNDITYYPYFRVLGKKAEKKEKPKTENIEKDEKSEGV